MFDFITASVKTPEQTLREEFVQINNMANMALEWFIRQNAMIYRMFWSQGTSPELKAQFLQENALEMFTKSATTQAFIKSMKPDHVELGVPEDYTTTWSQDGSVVIAKKVVENILQPEQI